VNRSLPPEIADIEAEIRGGHSDLQGLCLALADWSGDCGSSKWYGHNARL
jgi:hypothetical protein